MSATNRGTTRNTDDHYATPPQLCELICKRLRDDGVIEDPVNILEPGCGEGFFLDAFRKVWPEAVSIGVDINEHLVDLARSRGHEVVHADLFSYAREGPDWSAIIGNPPFSLLDEFIEACLPRVDPDFGSLAFLMRLDALGSKGRYDKIWSKHPPARVYVMPERPGFTPDGGTDSIEYQVGVWKPSHEGPSELHFLDNRGISNKWAGLTARTRRQYEEPDESVEEWA